MNYIFYDFETTGRNSDWDQILQLGAILTDEQFQEIDRFEAKCPRASVRCTNINNINIKYQQKQWKYM